MALGRDEHSEEDDILDPLEKATVDDISPTPSRHKTDRLDGGVSPRSKSRLVVKDTSTGLRGRKVKAFVTDENNDSLKEYSDEEQDNIQTQIYGYKKEGLR